MMVLVGSVLFAGMACVACYLVTAIAMNAWADYRRWKAKPRRYPSGYTPLPSDTLELQPLSSETLAKIGNVSGHSLPNHITVVDEHGNSRLEYVTWESGHMETVPHVYEEPPQAETTSQEDFAIGGDPDGCGMDDGGDD